MDLDQMRARLDAGADPNSGVWSRARPLHVAAEHGAPEVVAELAGRVDDVDAEQQGRTALWVAVIIGRDMHPGGEPGANASAKEVLVSYLYRHDAVAYSCAGAGLRLTDARAITGPPDKWVRLAERDDYWH